jgi:hypothetical protein
MHMSYKKCWFTGHAFPAKWDRAKSVFESFGFSSLGCALKFWNNFIAKISCVDFPSMLFDKTRKKSENETHKWLTLKHANLTMLHPEVTLCQLVSAEQNRTNIIRYWITSNTQQDVIGTGGCHNIWFYHVGRHVFYQQWKIEKEALRFLDNCTFTPIFPKKSLNYLLLLQLPGRLSITLSFFCNHEFSLKSTLCCRALVRTANHTICHPLYDQEL